MISRFLLRSSILLNLMLGVWLIAVAARDPAPPLSRNAAPAPAPASISSPPTPESPDPPAPVPTSRGRFHWSEVMSDDLEVYRDRLRGIGCPEETVRDILLAEIHFRVGEKRRAYSRAFQSRFWEVAARGGKEALMEEWEEPLAKFRQETSQLIARVLGSGANEPFRDEQRLALRQRWEQLYQWLPEARRNELIALEESFLKQREEIGMDDPDREQRLKKLERELEEARQRLFTPEEQEEFALRSFGNADWASRVSGFEPTEAEWRAITRLRIESHQAWETRVRPADGSNPGLSEDDLRQLNTQTDIALQKTIADTFGPDRYAQYLRGQDPIYQRTRAVTDRYDLPDDVAVQIYDLQQIARSHAEKTRQDSSLSADDRATALAAIQAETKNTLTSLLGPRAMDTYQTYAGQWIGQIVSP